MWKAISQLLAGQFGCYYSIKSKQRVEGGEMHEAWLIDDGVTSVFVKINDRNFRSMFRAEADQLELLAKSNTLRVPQVYGVGCTKTESFILLEALPLEDIQADNFSTFGLKLAALHLWLSQSKYGFDFDTWLGPVYQPNDWSTNWSTFFAEKRIGWQLQLCKEKGIEFGDISLITKKISHHLVKHQPKPALLHGDLWRNNCGVVDDELVVFDPACYWGDHECDLAFLDLFETWPQSFYDAYNKIYPISKNYLNRKKVYQLYYLLNFSHRFGHEYIAKSQEIIHDL